MAAFDTAAVQDILAERHRLSRSMTGGVFGAIRGMPMHLFTGQEDNQPLLFLAVDTGSSQAATQARESLLAGGSLSLAGLAKPTMVQAADETLIVKMPSKSLKNSDPTDAARITEDVIAVAANTPGGPPSAASGSKVTLVNQIPHYYTPEQVAELRTVGSELNQSYSQAGTNYPLGLVLGVVAMIAGALVWGAVGAFMHVQAWMIAIAAGWGIGFATIKGAGKGSPLLKVLIFVLTIGSVLLGEIFSFAFTLNQMGQGFDLLLAAELYIETIDEGIGSLLFALVGGLVGAFGAAQMADTPDYAPQVEVADDHAGSV